MLAYIKFLYVGIMVEDWFFSGGDNKFNWEVILEEIIVVVEDLNGGVLLRIVYLGDVEWDVIIMWNFQIDFVGVCYFGDLDIFYVIGVEIVIQDYICYVIFEAVLQVVCLLKK